MTELFEEGKEPKKRMFQRLGHRLGQKGIGVGTGAGVGAIIGGPAGAAVGASAGALAEEAYDMIVQKVTGKTKGTPEYQDFAQHLEHYLVDHRHRIDDLIGITEHNAQKLASFEKTYASLHKNIAEFDEELHREVLMRALARSAVVDAGEDISHLPNKDTLVGIIRQTKALTPRQIAIISSVSVGEGDPHADGVIDNWAQGPWWMELDDDDKSTVNERRLFQEIFALTQGGHPLLRHGKEHPHVPISSSGNPRTPEKWTDVDPQDLALTRDGRDFCKILDLQALSPQYRLSVIAQISPMGAHLRELTQKPDLEKTPIESKLIERAPQKPTVDQKNLKQPPL